MTKEKRTKLSMSSGGPDSERFDVEIGKTYVVVDGDSRIVSVAVAVKGSETSPYVEVQTKGESTPRKIAFTDSNRVRGYKGYRRGPHLSKYAPAVEERLAKRAAHEAYHRKLAMRAHELFPHYRSWCEALDGEDTAGDRIVEALCNHFERRRDAKWWASFCEAWRSIGVLYSDRTRRASGGEL